jgi:hypothetical protein
MLNDEDPEIPEGRQVPPWGAVKNKDQPVALFPFSGWEEKSISPDLAVVPAQSEAGVVRWPFSDPVTVIVEPLGVAAPAGSAGTTSAGTAVKMRSVATSPRPGARRRSMKEDTPTEL